MTCSSSGDLIVTGIPSARIGDAFPALWPLLKPAYELSREKTDLLGGIRARDLQLWAIYEKNTAIAGIVTRLLRSVGTSGHLDCRIWLVGGDRLNEWLPDFLSKLILWAKSEGCTTLSGCGRKGWARVARRLGCVRIEDEDGQPCWSLAL